MSFENGVPHCSWPGMHGPGFLPALSVQVDAAAMAASAAKEAARIIFSVSLVRRSARESRSGGAGWQLNNTKFTKPKLSF